MSHLGDLDLTLKLADEGLSPDEQGELDKLIESEPLARRRHLQMLEVEAALRSARHGSAPALRREPSSSLVEERRVAAVLETIRRPGLLSWTRGRRLRTTGFVALATRAEAWHLRTAIVFGIALGLTLDEFALWLRLSDVYWSPEGIESVKAGAVVAALLAVYGFGQPFWHAVVKDLWRFGG